MTAEDSYGEGCVTPDLLKFEQGERTVRILHLLGHGYVVVATYPGGYTFTSTATPEEAVEGAAMGLDGRAREKFIRGLSKQFQPEAWPVYEETTLSWDESLPGFTSPGMSGWWYPPELEERRQAKKDKRKLKAKLLR